MSARARPARDRPAPARTSSRGLALRALVAVDGGARANAVVPELLGASRLAQRDRAFVTELVYGAVRMRRACDWLVDRHLRRAVDPEIRAALRLGAYQLLVLQTPAHAAVSATVAEVAGPARGLVNAVLRRVAEDLAAGPPAWPDLATELSYPDWIVERLSADIGPAAAEAALRQMDQAATVTMRADGYRQDEASQLVAAYAAGPPGGRVLDVCAAPGGKATALAGGPAAASLVVAADIDLTRARVMAGQVAALGLANVALVVADGRRPPFRAAFERVLIDAPCSGLGALRRRPDARWRAQPGDVPRLAELQRDLLQQAIPLIAPGGRLVYSVCTLTETETLGVDDWLAAEHPELTAEPGPGAPWEPAGRGARLFPQTIGSDGMFILALRAPG
jgi:16S rRNA (cytosine967-C5)-methyltransferase